MDSHDELTSSYRHPWVWVHLWYIITRPSSRTRRLSLLTDGFNRQERDYRDILFHSVEGIAVVLAWSMYRAYEFFSSCCVDWCHDVISLAYCELYLTVAAVFAPGRFHFELFETDDTDVEIAHDFFIPYFRQDSKGIRVLVNWADLKWWIRPLTSLLFMYAFAPARSVLSLILLL